MRDDMNYSACVKSSKNVSEPNKEFGEPVLHSP